MMPPTSIHTILTSPIGSGGATQLPIGSDGLALIFAAVLSADAAAILVLLADAEASGTFLAALTAAQTDTGETALYVAAEAGSKEVVRLFLPLYDFEAATIRLRLDLGTFHVTASRPTPVSSLRFRFGATTKCHQPATWQHVKKEEVKNEKKRRS